MKVPGAVGCNVPLSTTDQVRVGEVKFAVLKRAFDATVSHHHRRQYRTVVLQQQYSKLYC